MLTTESPKVAYLKKLIEDKNLTTFEVSTKAGFPSQRIELIFKNKIKYEPKYIDKLIEVAEEMPANIMIGNSEKTQYLLEIMQNKKIPATYIARTSGINENTIYKLIKFQMQYEPPYIDELIKIAEEVKEYVKKTRKPFKKFEKGYVGVCSCCEIEKFCRTSKKYKCYDVYQDFLERGAENVNL